MSEDLTWRTIAETANATRPTIRLTRAVRRNVDLLSNSGSLMGSTVVTSVLGFGYWWLAARAFPPEAVGSASAAVTAMSVVGTIGMAGMGTLLIGELPGTPASRQWNLISACLLVAGAVGTFGGLVYVGVATFLVTGLRDALGSPALLIVGVAVTAMALVLDEALVGLLAGRLQLLRNAYFAVSKLILLAGLAVSGAALTGGGLLATWVAGTVLSVLLLAMSARPSGSVRPAFATLRGLRRRAAGHKVLNLALFLPRMALPLVVAAVLSTRDTAGFYTAWMIFTLLIMVPNTLATTVFAVAAGDLSTLRSKTRMALFVAVVAGVPASALLAVLARPVMGLFGPEYAAVASGALAILALTYLPTAFRLLFVAIARVRGLIRFATTLAVLFGVAELAAAWYGGTHGLYGGPGDLTDLTAAFAVVVTVEGLVMAPLVLRSAR